jgi:serine/threonine protein kinase
VKVLDFGIAKATFEEREAKSGSLFIGSKGYIPPERILMQEGQGVDVFALGVVLAEGYSGKATGQCPIDPTNIQEWKENYQVWQQLVLGRLSGAPKVFVQLIQQMLAFDAKNRPSMDIVEDRLEELSRQASGPRLKDWIADVLKKDAPRSTPAETLTRETLLNVDTALVPAKKRPYQTETVLLGAAGLGLLLVSSLVCTSGLAIRFFWPESVRVSTEQAAPAPTAAPVVSATQSETPPPISIDDTPAVPEAATPVIKATPTPARTPTPVSKATPTPKATPVPAATPTLKATPTPAVSTGSIVVEGAQGRLKGGGSLDSVVPGSVTIIVSFPSGATREFPMNVYAGQTITLRCDPAMENCSR